MEFYLRTALILAPALLTLTFPRIARFLRPIEARRAEPANRTVLIVSYYAPPYRGYFGTQRMAKFAKYLSAAGWTVVFLTTRPRHDTEIDAQCEPLADAIEVVRIDSADHPPFYRKGLYPPDDFVFRVPHLADALAQIVSTRPISAILATVPPYSVAVAAALIAVRARVPLVTDFRDPWNVVDPHLGWTLMHPFARLLSATLERAVLTVSARVIMVSELRYFTDYFVQGVTGVLSKTVSIRNGFDDDDFVVPPDAAAELTAGAPGDDFVISYAGVLYSAENVDNILQLFDAFKTRYPAAAERVCFHYAGANGQMILMREALPVRVIDHGFVTHQRANELRMRSHVQLFSQPRTFAAHVSSGKIFEMIRVGVPILAISRSGGAVSRLLADTRTGIVFEPQDAASAAVALKRWFDQWEAGERPSFAPDLERIQSYSRKRLSAELSAVLDDAMTPGAG